MATKPPTSYHWDFLIYRSYCFTHIIGISHWRTGPKTIAGWPQKMWIDPPSVYQTDRKSWTFGLAFFINGLVKNQENIQETIDYHRYSSQKDGVFLSSFPQTNPSISETPGFSWWFFLRVQGHYLVAHPTNRKWATTLVINGISGGKSSTKISGVN